MRLESDGKTTDCNPVKTRFDSGKALHLRSNLLHCSLRVGGQYLAVPHKHGKAGATPVSRHHLPDVLGRPSTLVASTREFDPLIRLHRHSLHRLSRAVEMC